MQTTQIVTNTATVLLVGCAVTLTAVVVRREFIHPGPASRSLLDPVAVDNWESLASGHASGHASAPVTILDLRDRDPMQHR
jgi:hypothetical protein